MLDGLAAPLYDQQQFEMHDLTNPSSPMPHEKRPPQNTARRDPARSTRGVIASKGRWNE